MDPKEPLDKTQQERPKPSMSTPQDASKTPQGSTFTEQSAEAVAPLAKAVPSPAPPPSVLPRSQPPSAMSESARPAQVPLDPSQSPDWTLVFVDDFSVDTLALPGSPWDTIFPWGPSLPSDAAHYSRYSGTSQCDAQGRNHVYTGSSLSIVAKLEPGHYDVWNWPNNVFTITCAQFFFTSGLLYSKQSYLYGYFEIRCKIPGFGLKLWPSFWLFGQNGDTSYREIDVFEFTGHPDPMFGPTRPQEMLTNIHISPALDFGRSHHQRQPMPNPTNDYGESTTLGGDITNDFHSYAVAWLPDSVTWYFDGLPIRMTAGHSPPLPMNVIAGMGISGNYVTPAGDLPLSFEIDYIKIYKSTKPEMLWVADNGGSNQIAVWHMNTADQYIVGDFDGDGRSELLAFAANGWSHMMKWDGSNWQYAWGNNGAHQIAVWNMNPTDHFVVGDFDGDGKSELLAFANNGWSHMMRWDGSNWQYTWGNNGSHKIAVWSMNSDDQIVVGDFDGDGKSELLAFASNGWSQMMRWDGSNWQYAWGNSGSHKIASWEFNAYNERYCAADFDGDGKSELVAFSDTGSCRMLRWSGGNWQDAWFNWDSVQVADWQMDSHDKYIAGDFDGDGKSELLAFSHIGMCELIKWNGTDWQSIWSNSGGATIHRWFMMPTDKYFAGKLFNSHTDLIAISANGWEQVMRLTQLP
jgi:hypothetical protein